MVALAGVYAEMARKVTTGRETAVACLTDMFFLGGGQGRVRWRGMGKRPWSSRGLGRGAAVGVVAGHFEEGVGKCEPWTGGL